MIELLKHHSKTSKYKESRFRKADRMGPTPSKDDNKIIAKMTTNNSENSTKLTYKAADFRSLTPICKKIFKANQHQTVLYAKRKSFIRQSVSIANYIDLFSDIPVASSAISNHQPDESIEFRFTSGH